MNLRIPAFLLMLALLLPAMMFSQVADSVASDSAVPVKKQAVRQVKDTTAFYAAGDTVSTVRPVILPVITDTVSVSFRERDPRLKFNVRQGSSIYGSYVGGYFREDSIYHVAAPVKPAGVGPVSLPVKPLNV